MNDDRLIREKNLIAEINKGTRKLSPDRIIKGERIVRIDEVIQSLREKLAEIITEVASRDYRVWKAVRLSVPLEELYPGEGQWYREKMENYHQVEKELNEMLAKQEEIKSIVRVKKLGETIVNPNPHQGE